MISSTLAYLDPGSGSMILQIVAGGLAAVAVTAKLYWNRLLRFFRIKRDDSGPDGSYPCSVPAPTTTRRSSLLTSVRP